MLTPRCGSAALHLPELGVLVVGGEGNSGGSLRIAELLETAAST